MARKKKLSSGRTFWRHSKNDVRLTCNIDDWNSQTGYPELLPRDCGYQHPDSDQQSVRRRDQFDSEQPEWSRSIYDEFERRSFYGVK